MEALRKEEEERVMREEEAIQRKMDEERAKTAYEEMMKLEKEKAAMREVREAKTREQREKNEPAFKKRKVLDRIQHVFEKNMAEDGGQSKKLSRCNVEGTTYIYLSQCFWYNQCPTTIALQFSSQS